MDDAKKQLELITKEIKAAEEKVKKTNQEALLSIDTTKKITALKPDTRQLPARNNVLLTQLPKKVLSRNELLAYLNTLDQQLAQKIKSPSTAEVNLLIKESANDGETLASLAIAAWYKNDPEAAVLLASKASALSIDDDASLSNCAAIFVMAGLENKAIPILQVLLQRQPNSSTVLNNLGQAYTGMGQVDTAIHYFMRCIRLAPEHPEANNTAAVIVMKKGQTEQAKKYCTQSLKGALTSGAIKTYSHLYTYDDIGNLIDLNPWKLYTFNESDYTFPEQCENVADAAKTEMEIAAYAARYRAMNKKQDIYAADMMSKMAGANMFASSLTPHSRRAGYAYHRIVSPLVEEYFQVVASSGEKIDFLNKEYDEKKKQLSKSYSAERLACGNNSACEGKAMAKHCQLQDALSNEYLPRYAVVNRDYVRKIWRINKEKFQALSNYVKNGVRPNTIAYYGQEGGRVSSLYSDLINGMILGSGYKIIRPYCDDTHSGKMELDTLEMKENKDCVFKAGIQIWPLSMVVTCADYEITGKKLTLNPHENFQAGQSTVIAGVAASGTLIGFEATVTQFVSISFDNNNQPVDVRTVGKLAFDVKDIVTGVRQISVKTSLNTGLSLEPGPLRSIAGALPYVFK